MAGTDTPQTPLADFTYMTETYGRSVADRMFNAGLDHLKWARERAAGSEHSEPDSQPLANTAADMRILYGTSVVSEEEAANLANDLRETVGGHLHEKDDLKAALSAATYRILFGDRSWSEDDDHRMFLATESRIEDLKRSGSSHAGHVYGLTEPLFALRALYGKSHRETSPIVRDHVRRIEDEARSEISTPANQKGFDHIHWPMDWDGGPITARVRVLGAKLVSITTDHIDIVDR